jgi:hypothetical protein
MKCIPAVILAAAYGDGYAIRRKKGPPTSFPTATPTDIPTKHLQMVSPESRPLAEICDKKNAAKIDVCIEWFETDNPSAAPSTTPSTSPSVEIITSGSPTTTKTQNVIEDIIDDRSDRILIQLSYFDMTITIISESKMLRSSDTSVHYRQGGDLTRQYEHAATNQHLHEMYTKSFLNPLIGLNLTFIDAGETNISATSTRSSIFYGTVEFEKLKEYPDPTLNDVEYVTGLAFIDNEKSRFLDEFCGYHGSNANTFTYDVIVQRLDDISNDSSASSSGINESRDTRAVLPIVGMIAGAFTICITCLVCFVNRRNNQKQRKRAVEEIPSPIRQILQNKREFDGNNFNDAYMDSASITSRNSGDSFLQPQLKFHEERVDNLRELGVEQIAIPTIVKRLSASTCFEDDFVR